MKNAWDPRAGIIEGFHVCTYNLCALCAGTGEQESFCSGAMVEQPLALVHHCDAFAREDFDIWFFFDTAGASCQKHAELTSREPHRAIRTEK